MAIGLALEGDGTVGTVGVAILCEAQKPLEQVEQIEAEIKELTLLEGMDVFVTQVVGRHGRHADAGKDNAEEVDGIVALEGNEMIVDDLHGCKINNFCTKLQNYAQQFVIFVHYRYLCMD